MLAAVIFTYSAQKLQILINKTDNEIILTELHHFYSDQETFTAKDGFNVAFGLNLGDIVLEDTVATFYVSLQEWTVLPNGTFDSSEKWLDIHRCSREELGLEGENSTFYPVLES